MKILINLLLIATVNFSSANIIVVNVSNFQFNPLNFTATVGDVVRFTWVSGTHTTTSDITPVGATTWDQPMSNTSPQFDYIVSVPGNYHFFCSIHPFMTASFTANAAAPVKLGDITVKGIGNNKTILNWETFTEENTDFFSILKSEDGKEFHQVGRIKATGNSITLQKYSFTDQQLNPELRYLYYQLVIVDLDGKKEYSKIVLFKSDSKSKNIIVKLTPNPVKEGDHLQLWFNADQESRLKAQIYDVSGKLVFSDQLTAYKGVNFGHLHIHSLQSGTFFLRLSNGSLKQSVKFIVEQ